MSALTPMRGVRIARLVVTSYIGRGWWAARCDCGRETAVMGIRVRHAGTPRSCGCAVRRRITPAEMARWAG